MSMRILTARHGIGIVIIVATGIALWTVAGPAAAPAFVCAPEQPEHDAKLDVKIDELVLDGATLEQAVALIQEKTHANIVIDWNELDAQIIRRATKVRLRLYDMDLEHVLQILLGAFRSEGIGERPAFGVKGGVIHVTAVGALESEKGHVTYMYDVRDFTTRFICPNDPPPETRAQPNGLLGGNSVSPPVIAKQVHDAVTRPATMPVSHLTRQECIDMLTRLIEEEIVPETWRDNGGQVGAIKELDGILIVTHSPDAHRAIQRLLANLRKLRASIDRGDPPTTRPFNLLEGP